MTKKIEIADNNVKSRFSCEMKNSLIFHKTEIIVILRLRPSANPILENTSLGL